MSTITRLADKELRFIIREFVELHDLLRLAKAEARSATQIEAQRLLRLLERGLRKEERVEYHAAKNFIRLRKAIVRARFGLYLQQDQQISELIRQAMIYDNTLKKLSAKGGDIEKKLKAITAHPTSETLQELQAVLEEGLSADRSFEAVINQLIAVVKEHKTTKSALLLEQSHQSLALLNYKSSLILFDIEKVIAIIKQDSRMMAQAYSEQGRPLVRKNQLSFAKRYSRQRDASFQQITSYRPADGIGGSFEGPPKLDVVEDKIMKQAIIGYCDFNNRFAQTHFFCGAWELFRIAAKPGYGSLMFELALSYASQFHKPVVIDRGDMADGGVTIPARKMLQYFDLQRRDVLKYPAALAKYPELIGYSKENSVTVFGTKGTFYSSTFDRYGLPIRMTEEMRHQRLLEAVSLGYYPQRLLEVMQRSYQEKEGGRAREVVGGLASLDKAYYYDGKKGLLIHLLAKWKTAGELSGLPGYGATAGRHTSTIYNAGYAFFQSFSEKKF